MPRPSRAQQKQPENLKIEFKPVAWNFLKAVTNGPTAEIGCFGARGDRKTTTVLAAMAEHAKVHHASGFPLPVEWMGAAYTFQLHQDKTHRSMMEPLWCGAWHLTDGGKIAEFWQDQTQLVRLSLFGIPDTASMENVRRASHCMWFEEPAPAAVTEYSGGLSEFAWRMGITSCRLPSHFNAKVFTSNLPDEDHWTWRMFVGPNLKHLLEPPYAIRWQNRVTFRIPPGEGASKQYRDEGIEALKDRPDLLRRLFDALPGSVLLGLPVATNYRDERHIAPDRLHLSPTQEIAIGTDFGHTPTVVVGQEDGGRVKVFAAMCEKGAGIAQLIPNRLQPWLARNAPWSRHGTDMVFHCDPQGEVGSEENIDQSAVKTIQDFFPQARVELGPREWEPRKDALITGLERFDGIQLDPVDCEDLIKALRGRAYYPTTSSAQQRSDRQKKPNHPWEDYIDALCYLLYGVGIGTSWTNVNKSAKPEVKRSVQRGRR